MHLQTLLIPLSPGAVSEPDCLDLSWLGDHHQTCQVVVSSSGKWTSQECQPHAIDVRVTQNDACQVLPAGPGKNELSVCISSDIVIIVIVIFIIIMFVIPPQIHVLGLP